MVTDKHRKSFPKVHPKDVRNNYCKYIRAKEATILVYLKGVANSSFSNMSFREMFQKLTTLIRIVGYYPESRVNIEVMVFTKKLPYCQRKLYFGYPRYCVLFVFLTTL